MGLRATVAEPWSIRLLSVLLSIYNAVLAGVSLALLYAFMYNVPQ